MVRTAAEDYVGSAQMAKAVSRESVSALPNVMVRIVALTAVVAPAVLALVDSRAPTASATRNVLRTAQAKPVAITAVAARAVPAVPARSVRADSAMMWKTRVWELAGKDAVSTLCCIGAREGQSRASTAAPVVVDGTLGKAITTVIRPVPILRGNSRWRAMAVSVFPTAPTRSAEKTDAAGHAALAMQMNCVIAVCAQVEVAAVM